MVSKYSMSDSFYNEKKVLPFLADVVPICRKITKNNALSEEEKRKYAVLRSLIDGYNRIIGSDLTTVGDIFGKTVVGASVCVSTTKPETGSAAGSGKAVASKPSSRPTYTARPTAPTRPKTPKPYDSDTDEEFSDTDSELENEDDKKTEKDDLVAFNDEIVKAHQLAHYLARTMVYPVKFCRDGLEDSDDEDSESEEEASSTEPSLGKASETRESDTVTSKAIVPYQPNIANKPLAISA